MELAHDIDSALELIGLPRDERELSPHLTLARIKQPVPLDKLHQIVATMENNEFASFQADRFYLYRSQPGRRDRSTPSCRNFDSRR